MPQMAPLNWIMLFISFMFLIIIILNKIFFLNTPLMNKTNSVEKNNNEMKWLW